MTFLTILPFPKYKLLPLASILKLIGVCRFAAVPTPSWPSPLRLPSPTKAVEVPANTEGMAPPVLVSVSGVMAELVR